MKRFTKRTIDNWESYIVDNGTGKEYGSQIDPILELLNELQDENQRLLELSSGPFEFAKNGRFSCLRRDGKYYIFSENVIPKNKAIISINSPDILFNDYIVNSVMGLIEELSENESFKHRGLFHE